MEDAVSDDRSLPDGNSAPATSHAARRLWRDLERSRAELDQLRMPITQVDDLPQARQALSDITKGLTAALNKFFTSGGGALERAPARVSEIVARIARSHDPEGDRINLDVPALFMNLDAARLERIVDVVIDDALHHDAALDIKVALVDAGMLLTFTRQPHQTSATHHGRSRGGRWRADSLRVVGSLAAEHGGHVRLDDHDARVLGVWLPASNS